MNRCQAATATNRCRPTKRALHAEPGHKRRCQGTPSPVGGVPAEAPLPPPAHKGTRALGSAPSNPNSAPTASGLRAPATRPEDERLWEGECLKIGTLHGGKRRPPPPPPDALLRPPQCAKPARKSACPGVGDWPPHPHTPRPRNEGCWPRLPARRTGCQGRASARTQAPLMEARGTPPPLDALLPPPERATQARKSTPRGVDDVPAHPHNPRPRNEGSGSRRPARDKRSGEVGCMNIGTSNGFKRRPPPPGPRPATPTTRNTSSQENAPRGQ